MKNKKILFSILIILLSILMFMPISNAAPTNSHVIGIRRAFESGDSYKSKGKMVWELVEYLNPEYEGDVPKPGTGTASFDKAIYCLKAGIGFGNSHDNIEETENARVEYSISEILAPKIVSTINALNDKQDLDLSLEARSSLVLGSSLTENNINEILWIADNMYLPKHLPEEDRKLMRDNLLANAFAEEIADPSNHDINGVEDIVLTDDEIEVVQQLAIWYFTNNDEEEYNSATLPALQKSINGGEYTAIDITHQKDASILYDYLITEARNQAMIYSKNGNEPTIDITGDTAQTVKVNGKVLAGPFEYNITMPERIIDTRIIVEKKSKTDSNLVETVDYKIYKEDKTTEVQNIEEIIGEKFYIELQQDDIEKVKVKIEADYFKTTVTEWNSSNPGEQPIIIPEKEKVTISDEIELDVLKNFDLALRKFITGVNDEEITNREPVFSIDENGEKIYTHTKAPVEVKNGDTVIYTIRVYNEGEYAGYAQEIKDYIPAGLEYIPDNQINIDYKWVLSQDGTYVTTDYLSNADTNNLLKPFDEDTMQEPDYKDVKIALRVIEPNTSTNVLKNIAEISEDKDENGEDIDDIDSTPDNVDKDNYPDNDNVEDDDDFEKVVLEYFDLALRKFITGVNDVEITNRVPVFSIDENGEKTYTHTKEPVGIRNGDIVIYTIRVYNEGPIAGYAQEIKDYIPEGLEYIIDNPINIEYRWRLSDDTTYITTDYLSNRDEDNLLEAFDEDTMQEPDYKDVKVAFRVIEPNTSKEVLKNIAEISEDKDENGNDVEDIDSTPDNVDKDNYPDNDNVEDDDDFEKLILEVFDLALRKFINTVTCISDDGENTTTLYNREPSITLENDEIKYDHPKDPVKVHNTDLVQYTLRIYNEGTIPGYAKEIIDYIPEGLEFVPNDPINEEYGWRMYKIENGEEIEITDDSEAKDATIIRTNYLSKEESEVRGEDNLLKPFDITAEISDSNPDYREVKVVLRVVEPNTSTRILKNIAEIAEDENENGEEIDDIDSTPDNVDKDNYPENDNVEDDDDFEKVQLEYFDLALRKFITGVNDEEVDSRIPEVKYEDEELKYEHTKEPVVVTNNDLVTYTIRVYNEGTKPGYAKEITDNIPEGLEFVPDNETNINYRWQLSEDGTKITTDYLSREQNIDNLIKPFDKDSEIVQEGENKNPDYKEVKVVFRVTEENLPTDRIIINIAEISDDEDVNGEEVDDIDSEPGNDDPDEDDIDIEKVRVKYFDLSLLKYVSRVIITEDGQTTERDTGYNGLEDPEPLVKVEIDRKKLQSTIVKFVYTIKITNEGEIPGYATEIRDDIPSGLEFVQEDNPEWTLEEDNTITTRSLENTLLNPGESATVQVTFRWINNENNMGVKVNTAEISEDYNEDGADDIDSTPDNKEPEEDDIDEAQVILSIKTGTGRTYFILIGTILITLATGIILIKKFVL